MITIDKFYGETIEVKGKWKKLGLTIKSDKKLETTKEVEKHSSDLLRLAKKLITKEVKTLRQED